MPNLNRERDNPAAAARLAAEQLLSKSATSRLEAHQNRFILNARLLRYLDPTLPEDVQDRHLEAALPSLPAQTPGILSRFVLKLLELGDKQSAELDIAISQPFTQVYQRLSGQSQTDWAHLELTSAAYDGRLIINGESHDFSPDKHVLTASVVRASEAGNTNSAKYILAPEMTEPDAFYSNGDNASYPIVDPSLSSSENMLRVITDAQNMVHITGLK